MSTFNDSAWEAIQTQMFQQKAEQLVSLAQDFGYSVSIKGCKAYVEKYIPRNYGVDK